MLGKTLDHYEIISLLGKGGMGEVYRAQDTKLQREVAIKVLPPQMTRDPERVARFRREARTLASLNHANIAGLYGFEDIDGHLFLVMELVEGESLEHLLEGGALSLTETLSIARQIADGLEEAHENGIVHRDLKPANIMLTADGRVKILDFGLARAYQGEGVNESVADMSPTITAAMTMAGTILGTAAYMSPEQARGKNVDRRSDLWAFGVLMWEMLCGGRLFLGETISDTLAAILRADPDWEKLPDDTPDGVQRLIARCLERDPRRRLRDIGEARVRLERWDQDPSTMHGMNTGEISFVEISGPRRWLPWAITALAILSAVFFGWQSRQSGDAAPALALNIDLHLPGLPPPSVNTGMMTILGPKGDRLVYRGEDNYLYAKDLTKRKVQRLEGTQGAFSPSFSPDGQWIAYAMMNTIKRVAFTGGSPIDIVTADNARGLTWVDETSIVYTRTYHSGLSMVSLTDNSVRELTQLDTKTNERTHRWPRMLPDGQHVLFQVQYLGRSYEQSDVEIVDLQTGQRKTIYRGGSFPTYAASGHLLFARERTLFAIKFDLSTLTTSGLAVPVLEDVRTFVVDQQSDDGTAHYDFTDDGTLVYAPAGNQGEVRLVFLDLANGAQTALGDPGRYRMPTLSPDGRSLAVVTTNNGNYVLQIIDTVTGMATSHGSAEATEYLGAWSPDSQDLFWSVANDKGHYSIVRQRADRTDDVTVIYSEDNYVIPKDVSADGTRLLVSAFRDTTFWDTMEIDLATGELRVLLNSTANEAGVGYSPDGHWFSYNLQSIGGARNLRIADAATPARSIPVVDNIDLGVSAMWSPASDAIVTRHEESIKRYPLVNDGERLRVGLPVILQRDSFLPGRDFPTASIQSDLSRTLMMIPTEGADQLPSVGYSILVTDWFEHLVNKVPTSAP